MINTSMAPSRRYSITFRDNSSTEVKSVTKAIKLLCGEIISGTLLICLSGELGAGKTYLTQKLLKKLGVTAPVSSPTFVLMNSYECKCPVFTGIIRHIDAYRLDSETFESSIPLEEYLDQDLVIIEWPENISTRLQPLSKVTVAIEFSQ